MKEKNMEYNKYKYIKIKNIKMSHNLKINCTKLNGDGDASRLWTPAGCSRSCSKRKGNTLVDSGLVPECPLKHQWLRRCCPNVCTDHTGPLSISSCSSCLAEAA